MSVLIKGLEMPSECRECPLCQYYMAVGETRCRRTGEVLASGFRTIKFSGRSEHCQLAELPKKHGRLVDADEFMADICNSINEMSKIGIMVDGDYLWCKLNDALENAPTIVEAEGEDG